MTDPSNINQARELFLAEEYAAAEPLYRDALQASPEDPHLLLMLGLCLRGQGDAPGSLALFEKAAQFGEDEAEAHFYLARALIDQGDTDGARASLKRCLTISPNHIDGRTLLGEMELRAGRPLAAIDSLQAALRIAPEHPPVLASLALALIETGRTDQARAYAEQAVKADPRNVTAQVAMARSFQALGHFGFAEQCLRNALELRPNTNELLASLGGVLAANGQHGEAAQMLGQAIRNGMRTELTMLGLAISLQRLGRYGEAQKTIEEFLAYRPEHMGARAKLAEVHLDRKQLQEAGRILDDLDQMGAVPMITLLQARLAESKGDLDRAHALAATLHLVDDTAVSDQARLLSGRVARARGAAVAARKALDPLIQAGRREPLASWLLAEAIAAGGQIERSREVLERLLANKRVMTPPMEAQTTRRLAIILSRAGHHEDAKKFLDNPGWRHCDYLPQILKDSPALMFNAYLGMDEPDWDELPAPDGGPDPVFVLGWPGSGRDLLLAALEANPAVTVLAPAGGRHRREALGIPLKPAQLASMDEARFRLGRKRFFKELRASGNQTIIEPCWWEAASLPALARYFPGARIIVPQAQTQALEMFWRLAGYQDIDEMLAARNEDEELLAHLRPLLNLRFIDIDLESLLAQPERELDQLGTALDLGLDSSGHQQMASQLAESPYHSARHWQHYSGSLTSAVSIFDSA